MNLVSTAPANCCAHCLTLIEGPVLLLAVRVNNKVLTLPVCRECLVSEAPEMLEES